MPDTISLYNIIQTGGVVAVLLVIILGGVRKWWVFGWQYQRVEESNERWMELALRSTNLAESLDTVAKRQPPRLP